MRAGLAASLSALWGVLHVVPSLSLPEKVCSCFRKAEESKHSTHALEGAPLRCLYREAGGASEGREMIEGKRMQARGNPFALLPQTHSQILKFDFVTRAIVVPAPPLSLATEGALPSTSSCTHPPPRARYNLC